MATAEQALFTLLTTGSPNPVAAIVGTRVYPRVLPQGVQYPAIRYARISSARSEWRTLDGKAEYAQPRFQIDAYALTDAQALDLGQAVYHWLEGYRGTVAGVRIDAISTDDESSELEPGAGPGGVDLYRQRVDVFVSHPEP